jgi:hypothetical protein
MAGSDREAELTARLAALEARLAEVEARAADAETRARDAEAHAMGSPLEAMETLMGMVLPVETRGHLRAARKEQLLAVRSLIDTWIDRVDRKPDEPKRRRRETIPLEDA